MNSFHPFRFVALVLGLCMACSIAQAASIRAWLDRPVIEWGETVTLNIESDDTSADKPDLSALGKHFDIIQQNTSSQTIIKNGKRSASKIWAVALKAKAPGLFTIPALSVQGEQTMPLTLRVNQPQPVNKNEAAHAGEDVFLLASVSDDQPYVQQNIIYTLKLYYKVNLFNGNISLPNNAQSHQAGQGAKQIGKDIQYTTQVGQDIYRVIERRFAFQFTQSGSLTLSPSTLEGSLSSGRTDVFGRSYGGKRIIKRSPTVDLNVRPLPASAVTPFLPATQMVLTLDSGKLPSSVAVGEPVTVTLRLRTEGLPSEQLPSLNLPSMPDASVYPDKVVRKDLKANDRLVSEVSRGFAIVPSKAGTFTIPPVNIAWWNINTDQAETISWPGASITVTPSNNATSNHTPPAAPNASLPLAPNLDNELIASNDTTFSTNHRPWQALAAAGFMLWLITLALWWRQTAQGKRQANINRTIEPTPPPSNPKELNRLLRDNPSPAAITKALIRLANQQQTGALSLQDVCDRLNNAEQQAAVLALNKHRFAADTQSDDWTSTLDDIRKAFAKPPQWRDEQHTQTAVLPELYPDR